MLFCDACGSLKTRRTVHGRVSMLCPQCDAVASKESQGPARGKAWWAVDDKAPKRDTVGGAARNISAFGNPVSMGQSRLGDRRGARGRTRGVESTTPAPEQEKRPVKRLPPPQKVDVPARARFFPHDRLRDGQRDFVEDVGEAAREGKILVANAPTGLGKTASSLAPLVEYALRHEKRVFFLTSKQSQHKIAIDTLSKIRDKAGVPVTVADVINKQAMCPRPEAQDLFGKRFAEFCRREQVHRRCSYFENDNAPAIRVLKKDVHHVGDAVSKCSGMGVCPHQAAMDLAAQAHVVVCDYNYLFSDMREGIEERLRVSMSDVLLVVDEAHNLPDRIRDHLSLELSDFVIDDAMDELSDLGEEAARRLVDALRDAVKRVAEEDAIEDLAPEDAAAVASERRRAPAGEEKPVPRDGFIAVVNRILEEQKGFLEDVDYTHLVTRLELAEVAYEERFKEKARGIMMLRDFLVNWKRERQGLVRYATRDPYPTLRYKMLDPAILSRGVFESVHAAVLMSGTLHPGEMYRDVLGLPPERTLVRAYQSPFPRENRLLIVDADVTTAYQERGDAMYSRIAEHLAAAAEATPGNFAAFFPSYALLEGVTQHLDFHLKSKKLIVEERQLSKEEKEGLVGAMRAMTGGDALLCGVMGGSLSEGYDYEDNLLKGVAIVGLPFAAPSLDVQALIDYYNKKFGTANGRNYAYVHPTMNRVLQAAGRCIRSPTDRGVIILMDKRFNWSSYRNTYPPDFAPRPSRDPVRDVRAFWSAR